jgi:hypothetical protein
VLAKGLVQVHSVVKAGDAGSDHAPVLVEFSVATKTAPEGATTALAMRK